MASAALLSGGAVASGAASGSIGVGTVITIAVSTAVGTVMISLLVFLTVRTIRKRRKASAKPQTKSDSDSKLGQMSFSRYMPDRRDWFDSVRSTTESQVSAEEVS